MILDDVYKLNPGSIVTLYELDATSLGAGITRLHAGTNELLLPVYWQGNEYTPFPIKVQGFEYSTGTKQSRPTITVANVNQVIGNLIKYYRDLVGAKFTRKRTMVKYLDVSNFSGGNPTADPSIHYPDQVYYINRKVNANKLFVEFELATTWEIYNIKIPARLAVRRCPWEYRLWTGSSWDYSRASYCGYTGTNYFKLDDSVTSDPALDRCGKRLSSCLLRFGQNGVLPFGGFPAVGRIY